MGFDILFRRSSFTQTLNEWYIYLYIYHKNYTNVDEPELLGKFHRGQKAAGWEFPNWW